jgi:cell shape-determining protein MreC
MNDVAVSAGKSAFYSFFHNHSEHSVLATKIEALENKELDRELQEFHELRGEFKQVKENVSEIKDELKSYRDTMSGLRELLVKEGIRKS